MKVRKNNKRKAISIILAAVVMFTTMFCHVSPAEAATQNDAVAWAKAQIGKGLDYDHVYGNQCVDLIKYYYNYFGVARYAMGNANAYITNNLPPGWTRVYSGYQPGDVAVWKTNHSCNTCGTNSYGHVGIITSVNGSKFSAVNQNFNSKSYCTLNDFNLSALACAIRPGYTNPIPVKPNVTFAEYKQNGVWDTNAELYIKVMNPSKAHVSAVGCYLYDADGKLVKSYSESCSFNTSYVNYTCNFNSDMKYTLTAGTTYKVVLYAVVGGNEYKDTTRSFTTTGSSDKTAPVISDVSVYDISETGYKVKCKATDNVGVVRVQFPTWTAFQGQDDLQPEWWENSKAAGTKDASGCYVYEVKSSDHNGELGDYTTHIYAYDKAGNWVCYKLPAVTLKKAAVDTPQPIPAPAETKKPETVNPDERVADGNALASIAEREYNIYKGQAYENQYGTSPWCCNFVSWCAREAGITTDVMTSTATVQTMYDTLVNKCGAGIVSSPQRGDLVFYKYTDYDSERYHHIGIMTGSNETVQGNVNNTWWKGTPEALNNIKQITYVRPAYNGVYVPSGTAYFSSYRVNKVEETNAEVYIKVENPKREKITEVGCSLYDENGNLLKTYAEECSFTTSYVNYTCNFNSDMGYKLLPETSYQFKLYAVVGGKKLTDSMRSFTTGGSKGEEDKPATAPEEPTASEEPTAPVKPTASDEPMASKDPAVTENPAGPTVEATKEPMPAEETVEPGVEATSGPTAGATKEPMTEPAEKPTAESTIKPAVEESNEPVADVPARKQAAKPKTNPIMESDDEMDDEPTVVTMQKPNKVTGLKVKSRSKKIYASWRFTSSSKRTGYQLQYASNRSFTKSKKTINLGYYTTRRTLKKLKKGKNYYVRVREYNRAAGMTKYGDWSAVKKVKVR